MTESKYSEMTVYDVAGILSVPFGKRKENLEEVFSGTGISPNDLVNGVPMFFFAPDVETLQLVKKLGADFQKTEMREGVVHKYNVLHHMVTRSNKKACLTYLLQEGGLDVNSPDDNGNTALSLFRTHIYENRVDEEDKIADFFDEKVGMYYNIGTLKLLLANKADVNCKNNEGVSAKDRLLRTFKDKALLEKFIDDLVVEQ